MARHRSPGISCTIPSDAQEVIARWVGDLGRDGIPVTADMLKLRAQDVAHDLGIEGFQASWSWRQAFLKQHKLSERAKTRQGQITAAEGDVELAKFNQLVINTMRDLNVDVVFNADQTAVNFEYLPKRIINARGDKTVSVKCGDKEKERITAMLLGDSYGNKYPLFLIAKAAISKVPATAVANKTERHGFGKQVWKEVAEAQSTYNLQLHGNPTAWWNADLSIRFLEYHFGNRPQPSKPAILFLWDDLAAHWTPTVLAYAAKINVVLLKVPAHCTWRCQPADVIWNKPIKDRLLARWVAHLRQQISDGGRRVQTPQRRDIVSWVASAWDDLPASVIENGFMKASCVQHPFKEADDAVEKCADIVMALERMKLIDAGMGDICSANDIVDCYKAID
ncbi:TPA: hypothetical protein N0F65_009913 [Lagenidium giganteum]|uniref:HTH CENPB-type domain-containing protein n=1 Tax=Lagenidium giganteum TaxID=4803 RepID=A0AAV2YIM2_9STRA|nr:TPA: hypothetical protein N0F65_009913 [Lagenidium giganteum]